MILCVGREAGVRKGVIADFMTFEYDTSHHIGVAPDKLARQEHGCPDIPRFQRIKNVLSGICLIISIERERHKTFLSSAIVK